MAKVKKELTRREFWKRVLIAELLSPLWCILIFFLFVLFVFLLFLPLLLFSGTTYETDPKTYRQWAPFMPESIREYTVNEYSYTEYSSLDICRELFVDLTVTQEQFDELIGKARAEAYIEREAYYAEGHYELVYRDQYELCYPIPEEGAEEERMVGYASIRKVIYNPETRNIFYEYFDMEDSNWYALKDVAYFRRFNIDELEYVQHLPKALETTDPAKYNALGSSWFFPESLEGYTVNEYSYFELNRDAYLNNRGSAYEVFLDLTVSEKQLDQLLKRATNKIHTKQEAYYAEGYYEIVFEDSYRVSKDTISGLDKVNSAFIRKIIYNPETGNVVFVQFVTSGKVYRVEDVKYFNHFGIDEQEYVERLEANSK